jgi:hypothetical protein
MDVSGGIWKLVTTICDEGDQPSATTSRVTESQACGFIHYFHVLFFVLAELTQMGSLK